MRWFSGDGSGFQMGKFDPEKLSFEGFGFLEFENGLCKGD